MGVFELIENTAEIKNIIKHHGATEKLFKQAQKDGMTTLFQNGLINKGYMDICPGEKRHRSDRIVCHEKILADR